MSIKIIGTEAQVHWLTNTVNSNGTLTADHGVLYITRGDIKLGQVTAESYAGLTPAQAFERRYNGMKSAMGSDFVANDLIVFDKFNGSDFAYDTHARELINELYTKGRITFNANHSQVQVTNTNNEALLDYDLDIDIGPLLGAVKQSFGLTHIWDTKDPVVWRWGQDDTISEAHSKLVEHKLALLAAYTGYGKTKMSMEIATRLLQTGGLVLVTTPITDTKKGFEDNIRDYHFGADRSLKITYIDSKSFIKYPVSKLVKRVKNNELIFIVLTVQDLRYGDDTAVDSDTVALRSKYQELSGNIDLWIRDERHAQYEGAVTSQRLDGMVASYELDLTATPYAVFNHYRLEHIVSRTLLWGLTNRANTGLPSISIDCINTPISQVSSKVADLYNTEEGFDPRKLFVRENDLFVLEAEIQTIAERMYELTVSKKKNVLSIANDTELSDKTVGMWVLPNGFAGDSASDYLPALAAMLNKSSQVYYIDSYSVERLCPKSSSIGDYIACLQKEHGRVVILTCGKFLTGTDIEILGHVVLFDKINNIANFEQLMGRPSRIYPGKNHVKIYTLQPGAETGLVLGRMAQANAHLNGGTEWEVLDCIPLSEYDSSGSCVKISADSILAEVQTWFREQLKSRLPSHSLSVALAGCDVSLWSEVDTRQYKKTAPTSDLTEDNGSVVKSRVTEAAERNGTPVTKQQLTQIQEIEATIQTVMFEAQWVAYTTACYDYTKVLRSLELESMFGKELIGAVLDTIAQNSEIASMIDTYLQNRQQAWANLPPEDVYPEVFQNSDLKQNIGLVFTPFSMAEELLDNLGTNKYNVILVVNALSGTIPLALKKKYPNARIICGEYFPYFKNHLRNLGFEVYSWDDITKDTMKIDALVGNPPFQEISKDGDRKDQASNLWSKFWRKSFEITNDTSTIALVTPTTWLSPSADFKGADNFVNGHDRLWNVFEDYTSRANVVDVADHFPGIGSSFGYVVVDRSGNAGLSFSDNSPTTLGFLPKSNINHVSNELDLVNNLGSRFKINQDNSPDLRVSIPMTRTLADTSVEILSGAAVPTAGSDKHELYLYVHVNTLQEADAVKARLLACLSILNVDCKWSGFVNIQAVKLIKY